MMLPILYFLFCAAFLGVALYSAHRSVRRNRSTCETVPLTYRGGLSFHQLRQANALRSRTVFGNTDWTPQDWACALAGEVGEACNILKKIRRGDYGLGVAKQSLADELGDVQAYLDLLAHSCGIDLGEATRKKFNEVSDRKGTTIKL